MSITDKALVLYRAAWKYLSMLDTGATGVYTYRTVSVNRATIGLTVYLCSSGYCVFFVPWSVTTSKYDIKPPYPFATCLHPTDNDSTFYYRDCILHTYVYDVCLGE